MSEKRPADEEEDPPPRKYIRIKLASPSPERSGGSDTESIHSCQGYETELAKDTSDTSSSPFYNIEYEVTDNEKEKYYLSDDSDEDEDDIGVGNKVSEVSGDSLDKAMLGDTSEENPTSPTSNSDVDPGLPRSDYLDFEKCLLCQTDRKDISYPYCSTCFAWRKNFFPSRPKKHQKVVKKDKMEISDPELNSNISSNKVCENKSREGGENSRKESNSQEEYVEDSGVEGSGPQLSQDVENSQHKQLQRSQSLENATGSQKVEDDSSQLSEDVVEGPHLSSAKDPQISEDVVEGPLRETFMSTPSTSTSDSNSRKASSNMCRVCFLKPENGLFIHSRIAHVYGCYGCAKKIWYHSGGCPICRRKIYKVAKLFV